MKALLLGLALVLTACESSRVSEASPSAPASTPSAVAVVSSRPSPTPNAATPSPSAISTHSESPPTSPATWKVARVRGSDCGEAKIDNSPCFLSVSCPTRAMCVAVGAGGTIATSTNPVAGLASWTLARIDGSNRVTGVSCPSIDFCAAVDEVGNVITSGHPTGGASAWKVTHVNGTNCAVSLTKEPPCALTGVSCPSAGLCVLTDYWGYVVVSTDPTGGPAAWTRARVDDGYLSSVSCPSAELCVAVDIVGNVIAARKPTGGATAWIKSHVDGPNCMVSEIGANCFLSSVSCPTVSLCVALDESGGVISSTNPGGGSGAWNVTRLNGVGLGGEYSLHSGISCLASGLCVGVGNDNEAKGFAIRSTSPTGGAKAWSRTVQIGASVLNDVSCPDSGLCVAVGYWGDIITSA